MLYLGPSCPKWIKLYGMMIGKIPMMQPNSRREMRMIK
ncbi:hypothetical protein CR513_43187 [Mucuna pruriens]|uniref:Uncharacterized protein n=1 Tax=Mucuna pruriens TaxID=157652 RepID=A0A371FEP5_MUCPR|nr:hypothetical protein CR513_43187 [Mucuna pruriens]